MCQIDWSVTAQMLTAWAAIGALFVGPFLSDRHARKSLVSQSRQQWLDQVRNDIASLCAIHGEFVLKKSNKDADFLIDDVEIERMTIFFAKIRMMMNPDDKDHQNFLLVLGDFIGNWSSERGELNLKGVTNAFEPIRRKVWLQIKSGEL